MTRLDYLIGRIPVPSHSASLRRVLALIAALAAVYLVLLVARSLYSPLPLIYEGGVAYIEQISGVNFFVEQRSFAGTRDETITVSRYMHRKDMKAGYTLEGGNFDATEGPIRLLRQGLIPPEISGEWCSEVSYAWWPSYSQVEFKEVLPPLCVIIPKTTVTDQ